MTINEAKDQRGGELEFENGETLSYEGGLPAPPTFTRFVHLTPTQSLPCVPVHTGLGLLISRVRGISLTSSWGSGVPSSRMLRTSSLSELVRWGWVRHYTPSPSPRSSPLRTVWGAKRRISGEAPPPYSRDFNSLSPLPQRPRRLPLFTVKLSSSIRHTPSSSARRLETSSRPGASSSS